MYRTFVYVYMYIPIYQFKMFCSTHFSFYDALDTLYLQVFLLVIPVFNRTVRTLTLTLVSHQLSGM